VISLLLWFAKKVRVPDLNVKEMDAILMLLSWLLFILGLRWFHRQLPTIVTDMMMGMDLKGDDGPIGETGPCGEKGECGPKGDKGQNGRDGRDGLPGPIGPRGEHGPAGADGVDGKPGRDGLPGQPGAVGPSGEQGPIGADGINGKDGRDGVPGLPGAVGATGHPGEAGAVGIVGKDGRDGMPGPSGKPGKHGDSGFQGVPGAHGRDGRDGRDGKDGKDGKDGNNGNAGKDGQNCAQPPQPQLTRKKSARIVFNEVAGRNEIPDAETDSNGNAVGTKYDLGRDGAYKGLRVVFLQIYCDQKFDDPIESLKSKGFDVLPYTKHGMPTPQDLDKALKDASQFWIISDRAGGLEEAHLDVIQKHWQAGLGLYVFGENTPYFVDANKLLTKISGSLAVTPPLQLEGDSPGSKFAEKITSGAASGFKPHLVMTGIVKLFEGETLSYMNRDTIRKAGFEEIVIDHDQKVVVAARPRSGNGGPVIVDGGFTKLFASNWKKGGSDRFVRNCACWLSADTMDM